MKNMNNKNKKKAAYDPMAEARKNKDFPRYYKQAQDRIALAAELYRQRERMGISQKELAVKVGSTQKVISRIENADVNVGLSLLKRMAEALDFNCENWGRSLGFAIPAAKVIFIGGSTADTPKKCGEEILWIGHNMKK